MARRLVERRRIHPFCLSRSCRAAPGRLGGGKLQCKHNPYVYIRMRIYTYNDQARVCWSLGGADDLELPSFPTDRPTSPCFPSPFRLVHFFLTRVLSRGSHRIFKFQRELRFFFFFGGMGNDDECGEVNIRGGFWQMEFD